MNAEDLAQWLQQNVAQLNGVIQLDPPRVRIWHVFNWGGFVNHSFHVTDGTAQYHLKLTDDRDNMRKFETWIKVHHLLESRYRTPELIDRVEFREIGFSGLVFRHVDGSSADFCNNPQILQQVIETAGRLHRDEVIRSFLEISALPKTRFDHFVETYMDEVIDTVADYIDAEAVPSKEKEAKRIKKKQREKGLKQYTMKYGGPV